ncbi:MAG: hypothetical protein HQL46_14625 [Gammaproteobacteria bacterium]|nr:hypothetical protein [Gammaproteobacteria bacterium]
MNKQLHPDLEAALTFYLKQRKNPPKEFAIGRGVIKDPTFLTVEKLQTYLSNPLLNSDWVTLIKNKNHLSLENHIKWKMVQHKKLVFMDKQYLNDEINNGAAVVLEGLDILDNNINNFVEKLESALPCAMANCVALFSQNKNEAYGGHFDTDDVLAIQLSGEKHWSIHKPQQRRFTNTYNLSPEQMGPQIKELTMRPGDILYVPAGVPHACSTVTEHSLHLAFDLCDRTPNVEEINQAVCEQYNHETEDAYADTSAVIRKYMSLLKNNNFQKNLKIETEHKAKEINDFRHSIGRASKFNALTKFIK